MDVFTFSAGRMVLIGYCDAGAPGRRSLACRDEAGHVVATFSIVDVVFFPGPRRELHCSGVFLPDRRQAALLPGWRPAEACSAERMRGAGALH